MGYGKFIGVEDIELTCIFIVVVGVASGIATPSTVEVGMMERRDIGRRSSVVMHCLGAAVAAVATMG